MTIGPKTNKYPLILHFDDDGKPRRVAESNAINVNRIDSSSISTLTISATSYLGAPIGGVTAIGQLADVDPQITDVAGNLLIVGNGNAISGLASSTFAIQSDLASVSNTVTILQGVSGGDGTYLPLSGGTVTGNVIITGTLRSNTSVSAPTYLNLPNAIPGEAGVVMPDGETTHYLDGDGNWTVPPGGNGVSAFSSLVDTFTYASKGENILIVKLDETGLSTIPSNTYATPAQLLDYIPTSFSSTFALDTDLNNYIPTSVSTTFAQTSNLNDHTASNVHWTITQLNANYINTSGDTMTGTLNGISALFTNISATTYHNVTATVGSATTTSIGGLQLNGQVNTFYNGSGQWVSGVESSSILYLSGGTLTGGLSAPTISAVTYLNLPANQSSKGITIPSPVSGDQATIFYTDDTYNITDIACILQASSSEAPAVSATVGLYTSANRNGIGTELYELNFSSITTAQLYTEMDGDGGSPFSLAANNFVWIKINNLVNNPTYLHLTFYLTRT